MRNIRRAKRKSRQKNCDQDQMRENASDLFFFFVWHREVRNRTTFLERSIRKIGKSAQEETIWKKDLLWEENPK